MKNKTPLLMSILFKQSIIYYFHFMKADDENELNIVIWRIFALKIQSHWYIILFNDEIIRNFPRSYVLIH